MRIQELRLACPDLDLAQSFYGGNLGFKVLSSSSSSITFDTGGSKLVFKSTPHGPAEYHLAWNIPENQIEEARDFLVNTLPTQTEGKIHHFESWNAHAIYFQDPFGNILEFIARHDLDNASNERFSACSVSEISEIGIVTGNVVQTTGSLVRSFGLELFRTQETSDDFQAIGDDNGLFIVVRDGRPWFGSELKATPAPVEVVISEALPGSYANTGARLTVRSPGK